MDLSPVRSGFWRLSERDERSGVKGPMVNLNEVKDRVDRERCVLPISRLSIIEILDPEPLSQNSSLS